MKIRKNNDEWEIRLKKFFYPSEFITKAYLDDFSDDFGLKLKEVNEDIVLKIKPKKEITEECIFEFLNDILAKIKEEI